MVGATRHLVYFVLVVCSCKLSGSNVLLISSNYTGMASGNGQSAQLEVTRDGRFVAFSSHATDLGESDTNNNSDVYLVDRVTGLRRCISSPSNFPPRVPPLGAERPAISRDGRFVGFLANHSLLVPQITNYPSSQPWNSPWNFFVYDTVSNRYFLGSPNGNSQSAFPNGVGSATLSSDGRYSTFLSDGFFYHADLQAGASAPINVDRDGNRVFMSNVRAVTPDHRYVLFSATATNILVDPPKTNEVLQVYRRDIESGITRLVSVATNGGYASSPSFVRAISPDGRYVAFRSRAMDLQAGMGGGAFEDVFIRDMEANETWCLTINASGTGSLGNSAGIQEYHFSEDGRRLLFQTTLAPAGSSGTLYLHDVIARTNRLLATNVFWEGTRLSESGRYALYIDRHFDLISLDVETLRRQRIGKIGGWSGAPPLSAVRISADGRWTFFTSHTNEVAGVSDTNARLDVFAAPTISPRIESVSGTGPRTVAATAFPGDTVQLQRSGDLVTWDTAASGQASDAGTITLQDNAAGTSNSFYRLRSP